MSDEPAAFTGGSAEGVPPAAATVAFQNIEGDPGGRDPGAAVPGAGRLDLVLDIPVRLTVELGRTEISIRDVVNLGRGSVIELDRSLGEALDVRVNGVLIGRGEIVVVNEERLGLRFTEVVSQAERVSRLG
jgi:flagellar motor switch protein FliN/FliY